MPLVSYVVTLFNKRPYLPYVVAALKAQTGNFDRQYIFVDDGSTDDTVAFLRDSLAEWQSAEIIYQENAGPAAAMNAGFARARGDYIKPLDGDDVLAPWATAELLRAMEKTGTQMSFSPAKFAGGYTVGDLVSDVVNGFSEQNSSVQTVDLLSLSLRNAQTNPTSWMATRELVNRVGGCDTAVFIQDYSIEIRLAAQGPAARIESQFFKQQLDDESRMSDNQAQTLHDVNAALLNFLIHHGDQISPAQTRFGLKRAAGRSLSWARRHGGRGPISRELACFALANAGLLKPTAKLKEAVCRPFFETDIIRVPGRVPGRAPGASR